MSNIDSVFRFLKPEIVGGGNLDGVASVALLFFLCMVADGGGPRENEFVPTGLGGRGSNIGAL